MYRNLEELNGKHEGKPCCIVASGPSVGLVDLSLLPQFVTITVNAGIIACSECDYFLSDDWDAANWSYFYRELRYSQCEALLYEDKYFHRSVLMRMLGKRVVLFRHRKGYHVTDRYEHDNYDNHILQCRTSIGSAIHIAHIMGCSPIVLLGVDCCRLNGKRWFWEMGGWTRPSRVDNRRIDKYRRTKDSDTDLQEILTYWNDYADLIGTSCKVYNASPISRVLSFEKKGLEECLKA